MFTSCSLRFWKYNFSSSDVDVFVLQECTWSNVSDTWDQLHVKRTDTWSWTEAQLQQEVVAVLIFPFIRQTGSEARKEVKHKGLKPSNWINIAKMFVVTCTLWLQTLTWFRTLVVKYLPCSHILAVVSDSQAAGPQRSKQFVAVGIVWQVFLTWYLVDTL